MTWASWVSIEGSFQEKGTGGLNGVEIFLSARPWRAAPSPKVYPRTRTPWRLAVRSQST
jgi:hypothetical protein